MKNVTLSTQVVSPDPALWAFDPNEVELMPNERVLKQLKFYLGDSLEEVLPVYICGADDKDPLSAKEKVEAYLTQISQLKMHPAKIIYSSSNKRSDWVQDLLQVAKERRTQMIILTSHGRAGLSRLLMGSFAHELLQSSTLPILFLNLQAAPEHQLSKVLFTTDFSPPSKEAFSEFLKFIDGKAEELILFHAVSLANWGQTSVEFAPQSFFEEQVVWAKEQCALWLSEAKKLNMTTQFHSAAEESVLLPGEMIRRFAEREQVGLIGISSHIGPLAKLVLGGVTLDLLDSPRFPLWVCGPHFHLETDPKDCP